jgi:hypothetical protein
MLAADITLAGNSTTRDYALTTTPQGTSSIRKVATAPLDAPETLTVAHSLGKSQGAVVTDRHVARLNLGKVSGYGQALNLSFYVVIEVPRESTITLAMVKDMRTQMTNLLSDANLTKIVAGEL